jgi:hypothetical protein
MDLIGRGIIAGFLATLVLSAAVDPVATLARMADVLPPTLGWALNFIIGSLVWGASFALLQRIMVGPFWLRGLVFGLVAWLVVMLAVMPLTRGGLFALKLGIGAPAVMLAIHLAYGTALGIIYELLLPEDIDHANGKRERRLHGHWRERLLHPFAR